MGFETQEQAERFAEAADAHRDMLRELSPMERAWHKAAQLPAFKEVDQSARDLARSFFEYAWEAATKPSRDADKFARDLCQALNEGDGSYKP